MIAFAHMLVDPAIKAGIDTPEDADDYDEEKFPHFHLFCCAQLGRPMPDWTCHWDNAKIIKEIDIKDIKTTTFDDLMSKGFR